MQRLVVLRLRDHLVPPQEDGALGPEESPSAISDGGIWKYGDHYVAFSRNHHPEPWMFYSISVEHVYSKHDEEVPGMIAVNMYGL